MAGASGSTHYEVLGVSRTDDHDRIRRAYLEAARRFHPDRQADSSPADAEAAARAMRRVNEAWSVLGDGSSRTAYDRQLVPGTQGEAGVSGVRTTDGVTRIDPRLLDPEFLTARRHAQIDEISNRSSLILRAAPLLAVIGFLGAIFVFTAYARGDNAEGGPSTTVPGPQLGAGIEAGDCVAVIGGPALLEVPCSPTAAGRVFGAAQPGAACPLGTDREVELSNGILVCLDAVS